MNFYEQQASYNPNMPMRFLIYTGMVYSKYEGMQKGQQKAQDEVYQRMLNMNFTPEQARQIAYGT